MLLNVKSILQKINKVPKHTKVLVLIGILILLVYMFKPNVYKDFYKMFNKELERQETVSKKAYDSIQKVRALEKEDYLKAIESKDMEIMSIENELILEQQRNYRYEKELKAYRNSDFNERFRVFSNTYNPENDR